MIIKEWITWLWWERNLRLQLTFLLCLSRSGQLIPFHLHLVWFLVCTLILYLFSACWLQDLMCLYRNHKLSISAWGMHLLLRTGSYFYLEVCICEQRNNISCGMICTDIVLGWFRIRNHSSRIQLVKVLEQHFHNCLSRGRMFCQMCSQGLEEQMTILV